MQHTKTSAFLAANGLIVVLLSVVILFFSGIDADTVFGDSTSNPPTKISQNQLNLSFSSVEGTFGQILYDACENTEDEKEDNSNSLTTKVHSGSLNRHLRSEFYRDPVIKPVALRQLQTVVLIS